MSLSRVKRLGVVTLLLAVVISASFLMLAEVEAQASEQKTLAILHTNDEHGVIENFGRIAWKKQQLEKEYDDVILVSAGDAFSGNPVVDEYVIDGENLRGKPMVDIMNKTGYQVLTIGNHEFDYGQERLQTASENSDYEMILANLEVDPEEADMEQPPAYHKIETDFGAELAFLGVIQVSGDYPSTLPINLYGLNFLDPVETALEYTHLADESDAFIGLTHIGHDWDHELAEEMEELDIIIGGHSHTAVQEPVSTNDVLITQTGGNTEQLGMVTLTFDADNQIVDRDSKLIDTEEIAETNAEVEELIADFEGDVEEIFSRELSELEEPITGNEDLGGFMTDAVVESPELEDLGYDIDFAFQNSGGIRVDQLDAGTLTVGDIFELEPFGNNLIVYEMTTDDIRSLLRNDYKERGSVDLRVSGLHYEIHVDADNNVEDIKLYDYEGKELYENKTYTVALNSYIASSYEFNARNEGENSYIRHNDTIITFLEEVITQEELNSRYHDLNRTGTVMTEEGEIIGKTEVELSSAGKTAGSTPAGNLMADAIKAETGADVATFPSYSGLNEGANPIPAGEDIEDVKLLALYGEHIDENNAVVGEMSGAKLEELLLRRGQAYDNADLQVAGVEVTYITEDGEVADIETDLDPEKQYTVTFNSYATSDYQLEGFQEDYTTELTEQQMMLNYVKDQEVITEKAAEDRVVLE